MDSKLPSFYLDQFVRRVCVIVPEYRGMRLRYPVGALLLGLLLCECAGRFSQRSKEEWLKENWHWIKKFWLKSSGQAIKAKGTPSQSTISRLLSTFSQETFARLVYKDERSQLWQEWDDYLKASRAEVISRRKKRTKSDGQSFAHSIVSMARLAKGARAKRRGVKKLTSQFFAPRPSKF